ncbi:MAG: GNAT family N-acetyltransferase [Desulfobulbaceae bacterium]|nr:GNAT family N-acetyltransferase [Desulfobulbaceae bacterium]
MKMNIELYPIEKHQREIVHRLFQFYLYDMAKLMKWPFSDKGNFQYESSIVDAYFSEKLHYPYFIKCDNKIIGFSLVRCYPADKRLLDMGQFYVAGMYVGSRIGEAAFKKTLQLYPGSWQVRVLEGNSSADRFWNSVIQKVTSGNFKTNDGIYSGKKMKFYKFEYGSDAVRF